MKSLMILASIMFFAFVFAGCTYEYIYCVDYEYINATNKNIKIESYLY